MNQVRYQKESINEGGNMHVLGAADLHIMNVVDADRRNNSHVDIPYRIYLLNDVLQQTQIHP